MTLKDALSTLQSSLAAELPDWNVNAELIGYPEDKLVDIVYTNFDFRYVDMGTRAYVGAMAFYLYRQSGSSYGDLLEATDTVLTWLDTFNHSNIQVGNNTETVANVAQVEGTFDNDITYRVIEIVVPVEIIT